MGTTHCTKWLHYCAMSRTGQVYRKLLNMVVFCLDATRESSLFQPLQPCTQAIIMCTVIGYALIGMEAISLEIESPFGRDFNDLVRGRRGASQPRVSIAKPPHVSYPFEPFPLQLADNKHNLRRLATVQPNG